MVVRATEMTSSTGRPWKKAETRVGLVLIDEMLLMLCVGLTSKPLLSYNVLSLLLLKDKLSSVR